MLYHTASVCVAEFGTFWEEPCNLDLDYEEILKRNLKAKVNDFLLDNKICIRSLYKVLRARSQPLSRN